MSEKRRMCIREFETELRKLWEPFGGVVETPLSIAEQCKKIQTPVGLVFFYVPVEGLGPINNQLEPLNESHQDSKAFGYNFTSARLATTTIARRADGGVEVQYDPECVRAYITSMSAPQQV